MLLVTEKGAEKRLLPQSFLSHVLSCHQYEENTRGTHAARESMCHKASTSIMDVREKYTPGNENYK